ncbi:MAG TPA: hypothetical protein VFQ44_30110 [Streptosporangiaceae bacterium]|nr:hypothetical protein [Streptosporangiaceae bacterium]
MSYNLSAGIVTLTITGVDFVLTINSLLGTCMAEIKGTLGAIYNNATHLLQFTAAGTNLKVVSTSGACAGILKVNDALTFTTGSGGWIITGSPDAWIEFAQP